MGTWDASTVWGNDDAQDLAHDLVDHFQVQVGYSLSHDQIDKALVYIDMYLAVVDRASLTLPLPDPDTINRWYFTIIRFLHRNKQSTEAASKLLMHILDRSIKWEEDNRD